MAQEDTRPEFVIAVLGDSYASGEGSPDVHGKHSLGGDLFAAECAPGSPYGPCFRETWWRPDSWFPNRRAVFPQQDDPGWQNDARHCHRSTKGPATHAAMLIASRFQDVKITVLNFACGGAKITDGLLLGWRGPEPPLPVGTPPLRSQLAALEAYVSGTSRHVDAIVMNIGGNDARFADLVKECLIFELINDCADDQLLRDVGALLVDGATPAFPDPAAPLSARFSVVDAAFRKSGRLPVGVTGLEAARPHEVYLTGPPNPSHDAPPVDNPGANPQDFCDGTQSRDPDYNNAKRRETVHLENLLGGMRDAMGRAAARHGWIFLGQMFELTRDHGVCADDESFFRTNSDALRIQGDEGLVETFGFVPSGGGPAFISPGIAHQNEDGYAARARVIADVVEQQVRMRFRAPTLFLERVDVDAFRVRWQDPSPQHAAETRWELDLGSPIGQVVRLSSAVGPGQDITQTTPTRFSWGVVRGGEFTARLRGCRGTPTGDYCGPFSNAVTVVTFVPGRPVGLQRLQLPPIRSNANKIHVEWTPGPNTPGSVRYEVQHGPRTSIPIPCPGGARPGQTCISNGIDFGSSALTTTTSFVAGDLEPGEYGFQVRACSTAGCSPFSSVLIVKLTGILGPVQPEIPPRELLPPSVDPQPRDDRNQPPSPPSPR